MSTQEEEADALERAAEFLRALGSGQYKVTSIRKLRADARDILRHYPLAPRQRWRRVQ